MRTTILALFGFAIIQVSNAKNGGVLSATFDDEDGREVHLALFGGSVNIWCEIDCDAGGTVELIGPNGAIVSSGGCQANVNPTVAVMRLEVIESLVFGEYKCKYKDSTITERASTWIYHYRTCSRVEKQEMLDYSPKGLLVVDSNDRLCHVARTCGDLQHKDQVHPELVCPANVKSICHAAADDKYSSALVVRSGVEDCAGKPSSWYISYAGIPIVLHSMVQLSKAIRYFKVHCPSAIDKEVRCELGSRELQTKCTEAADIHIPDEVFNESGGKYLSCSWEIEPRLVATIVYAASDQNFTCAESRDGTIRCEFEPRLWPKFEIKKYIKCSSDEQQRHRLYPHWEIIVPSPEQCEEYTIVAEVFYEHPGTHDVFKLPLFQSVPFRKKPKHTEPSVTKNATESGATHASAERCMNPTTPPCKCNSSIPPKLDNKHVDSNSADSVDSQTWYIGKSVWWIVVTAMFKMRFHSSAQNTDFY